MKRFLNIILLLSFICELSVAQGSKDEGQEYSYFTMYYIDNSDGSETNSLNDEMVQDLKESLNNLTRRPDNFFFFYGSDGKENKTSTNLTSFLTTPTLKKYLGNPSDEADYSFDKIAIRDYFIENPVKAKQNIEINIYLSAYAVKRMLKEMEDVPATIFLSNELPMYLSTPGGNGARVKIRYF
ncbi:MAG: hypothetical protein IPP71_09625 [Bacteroidetes bacterium]|nr:hypothetical protein [Bacteroidota bacterium]